MENPERCKHEAEYLCLVGVSVGCMIPDDNGGLRTYSVSAKVKCNKCGLTFSKESILDEFNRLVKAIL